MTLGALLDRSADRRGNDAFLLAGSSLVTYGECRERVNALAGFLADLGVRHGDRIAVVLPNIPEMVYTWFALARLGAVMVPLNSSLMPAEVEPILRQVGCRGLVGPAAIAALWAERLDLAVKVVVGPGEAAGTVPFAAAFHSGQPIALCRAAGGDLSVILQTSGTTGKVKSCGLTHDSFTLPAAEFVRWMEVVPSDRFLGCLPLFHMAGQAFAMSAVAGGASLALVERFSAHHFWEQVRHHRVTIARHLGEMLTLLVRQPEGPEDRQHTLRAVYGGGARREVAEPFERRFGAVVVEGYGLTETNTVLRNELRRRQPGSIGRPLDHCEVRVADALGQALPASTASEAHVGEIQVRRNPAMMTGYLGLPEGDGFVDGWFRTGDLGYRDADGYFYFVCREKDTIRRRGETIAPFQIEEVLGRHPTVAAAAVVGVPDELGGEEVKAYVVSRPGAAANPRELVAWCRRHLAEFEVPRYLEVCRELPVTATNKINKSKLRGAGTAGGPCFDRQAGTWMPAHPETEWPSLVDLLQARACGLPRRAYTFLAKGEREVAHLTYAELDLRAHAVGARLAESGLAGQRALLLYPPGLEFIVAFFGCLYAGVVAVPAYPPGSQRGLPRLLAIAADARPAAVLTTGEVAAKLGALATQVPQLQQLRWLATDEMGDGPATGWEPRPQPGEAPAFLQYTSGSTSTPKGVVVSHGNLLHNERMIRQAFEQSEESVIVGWLPLYHDMGLIGNVLQPLYAGASCYLMSPLDFLERPRRWLAAVSRYRATTSGGPNFAYDLCLRKIGPAEREGLDLSSWRVAFNGSEPVRSQTLNDFAAAFAPCGFRPAAFFPCYGLAEATLFVTGGTRGEAPRIAAFSPAALEADRAVPAPDEGGRELVSSGRPWMGQEVIIVEPESRRRCAEGGVGEIWIAGPSVAQGYWRRPEATEEDFRARLADEPAAGPFLRTGDLGFLDGGELFVTGRLKDLIILRGRNLYPQDVEQLAERADPALRPGCGAAFGIEVSGEERLVVAWELDPLAAPDMEAVAGAIRQKVAEGLEASVQEVVFLT
ncbi:MAG TPA: AMP-binding protein, partial [Thermoanaerobaculia bacterium]|nr:AMP-binding protein [Thermoanaerobaculia bacterium]